MCLMHQYVQCVEVFKDNGLTWFFDVGLFPKYIHLEFGVFFKTIILFVLSFDRFYFIFWQLIHFILTYPKKPIFLYIFLGGTCP